MSLATPKENSVIETPINEEGQNITHKKVGNYVLLDTIGKGTFSKVSFGTHLLTNQTVAIKIMQKDKIKDKVDMERINREIYILKLTSHPNISQMYEIVSTKNNFYLVMEYINGGDLFDYIYNENKLSEEKACSLFRQIISCVEYLSRLGICHRDIKPENILLNKNKTKVKLIDFGLSNFCGANQMLTSSCGSPCYASPEMISCVPYYGIASDLWSCGVVLYCMLVGCLPFDDDDIQCLYKKILIGEFVLPSTVSSESIDLLKRILQVDPKKRITLSGIKKHKWFNLVKTNLHIGNLYNQSYPDENIVHEMKEKFYANDTQIDENIIAQSVNKNLCNKYSATYYLYLKEKGIENISNYHSNINNRKKNSKSANRKCTPILDYKQMSRTPNNNHNIYRKNSDFNVYVINNIISQNNNCKNNNISLKLRQQKASLSKTCKPNKTPSPFGKQVFHLESRNQKIKNESSLKSKTMSNSNDNSKEQTKGVKTQNISLNTTNKMNIVYQQNKIIASLIRNHLNNSVSAPKKKKSNINTFTESFDTTGKVLNRSVSKTSMLKNKITLKYNNNTVSKRKEEKQLSLITPIFEANKKEETLNNITNIRLINKQKESGVKKFRFNSHSKEKNNKTNVHSKYHTRINKILFSMKKRDNKFSDSKSKSKEKTKNLLLQKLFIPE